MVGAATEIEGAGEAALEDVVLGVLRIRGDALVFKPPSKDQKPH